MTEITGSFQPTGFSPKPLPILTISLSIKKPNGKLFVHTDEYQVDTGFDGDLKLPSSFASRLKGMGVEGVVRVVSVADGSAKGENFEAEMVEIGLNATNILARPQKCSILCMGQNSTGNLVGLNALRNWKVCFDIPQQILSVQ